MKEELIRKAVEMGARVGYALVATSDGSGQPHVAVSRKLEGDGGHVAVSEWFCPGTLNNIEENPRISIVTWDPETDSGFQLIGRSVEVEDTAMLDGFSPDIDRRVPQVQKRIRVRVETVLDFTHAPHTDEEEF